MQKTTSSTAPAVRSAPRSAPFMILAVVTVLGCLALALLGYLQPVVMGIVQGLGEFLPISSSAHLILVPWFFGWQSGGINTLTFDVALHIGTLIALLVYFWRDWVTLLGAAPGLATWTSRRLRGERAARMERPEKLLAAVIIATIPGAIAGVLLEKVIEESLRAPLLIAFTLALMGILLYVVDTRLPQRRATDDLTMRDALLIGLSQACALVPGVSRSGATMTMGRLLSLDRTSAARFSFLMSVPITGAAALLKLKDILRIPRAEVPFFAVGVLVSAAVGALAIHFLLEYIRRAGFRVFAIYRIALAILIVIVALARG